MLKFMRHREVYNESCEYKLYVFFSVNETLIGLNPVSQISSFQRRNTYILNNINLNYIYGICLIYIRYGK